MLLMSQAKLVKTMQSVKQTDEIIENFMEIQVFFQKCGQLY